MSTGLSDFPTDQELIDELQRAPSTNPSNALLDPNEHRWGFLEPENGDHPILDLPRGLNEYSIVPHQSNTNLTVVPARDDNHPRVQLVEIPGAEPSEWEFSLRTSLANGGANYRRFRDRDRLHFGDKVFIFNDTITLDGAFMEYQHIEGSVSVSGGFGYVTKVALRADPNVQVALKVVRSQSPGVNKKVSKTYEISALRALNHPHVCRIFDIFATKGLDLHITMEYAELSNLADRITSHEAIVNGARPLSVDVFAGSTILQLCTAMQYIHSQGIMHRDIKPNMSSSVIVSSPTTHRHILQNLLFTSMSPLTLKVADFGLAIREASSKTHCGTHHYMAPEIMSTPAYDRRVDLYSVGAVALDILVAMQNCKNPLEAWSKKLYGREPNSRDISELAEDRNACLQTDQKLQMSDPRALALVKGLLSYDPPSRISWEVALNNGWLQELDSRRRIAPQTRFLTPTESANGSTAEAAPVASHEELTIRRETTPAIHREVTPAMSHHDTTPPEAVPTVHAEEMPAPAPPMEVQTIRSEGTQSDAGVGTGPVVVPAPAPMREVPMVQPEDVQSVAAGAVPQPVVVPVEVNVRDLQLKRRSSRIAKFARDNALVKPYWLYRSGWERATPPP